MSPGARARAFLRWLFIFGGPDWRARGLVGAVLIGAEIIKRRRSAQPNSPAHLLLFAPSQRWLTRAALGDGSAVINNEVFWAEKRRDRGVRFDTIFFLTFGLEARIAAMLRKRPINVCSLHFYGTCHSLLFAAENDPNERVAVYGLISARNTRCYVRIALF